MPALALLPAYTAALERGWTPDNVRGLAANRESLAGIADDPELLADVACVALNRLAPRYIRHEVDFVFYLSERERGDSERQLGEAVEYAFGFVQARTAMRARG